MFATTENLLPNIIRRQKSRTRPFASIVGVEGVIRNVTFSDLENASNRAAWYLHKNIADDQVLYMGPNDIRYLIWVIAAVKTRKCVLFPSLANQIPANQRFFQTVGAKTLLYAPEVAGLLGPLLEATRGSIEQVATPTYEELTSEDVAIEYPFLKSYNEVKDTRFMGLHTSGTSGHPKPIYWTNSALTTIPAFLDPDVKDSDRNGSNLMFDLFQGNNILVPFPLSHFGGMGSSLGSIYCDNTIVLPVPGVRLTPENYTLLLQHGKCTSTATPPSILEAMLNYPLGVEALASLKCVGYTGGPVNPNRGEILANKIPHLFPILASTEGGIGRFVSSGDSSHWNSFKFVDVGQRMEEVAPGIYELVYPRTDLINRVHAYFHTHPHLKLEFRTSDLFSPIDDKNEWWVYKGRADNWIAMSNGLKMDPSEIEHDIASHPDVIGVVVAGAHRFRLCVLIELNKPVDDQSLDNIWPIIEEANKKAPKFGRLPKELVLFATPEKPFLRAGKGTIQRRLTIQAYEVEINRRYDEVEEGLLTSGIPLPASIEPKDLIPFLKELCSETLLDENAGGDIGVDDDIVAFGLDSLSSFVLLARLKAALRKYGVETEKVHLVNNKLLYTAPTIRQLAEKLSQLLSTTGQSSEAVTDSHDVTIKLLEKYGAELQKLGKPNAFKAGGKSDGEVVLLTGSTGSLGSHILASLLAKSDVKKIFLLNRNGDTKSQSASLKSRGLPSSLVDDKRVVFFKIKPTEPKFGLSDGDYASLSQETTAVIHNAYPVNFLLSVQSFEPQFQFLLSLLKLAVDSPQNPAVLFVSSITAATPATVGADGEAIPEEVLHPEKARGLLQQGYARSKYVCERLLANYASHLGGRASVLRVGQVCGPSSGTGIWNMSEWVPSLVLSSKFLGAIPESLGSLEVNWVPVDKLGDIVAEIVCDASQHEKPEEFQVFNVVNPAITSWGALLPALKAIGSVDVVSASEWIDRLEKSDKDPHIIPQNPAAKIVDFYKQTMVVDEQKAAKIEVANLLRASQTAANLPPIDQGHMARWMQGWGL
ncbi:uncharacterized protein F4822DRAFT_64821 [Hypoxylon trugodes]|uniref:uncharacterized protein n=1 Tax=Hypoxylon trugodes TaxID=326681 RepID=UPI002196D66C|nr:uncharacterized protein F4822DRAFT_64821 [Hypoxylon trugodes]KAI1384255.1 hypothetical protein F4822DRAFT_64821 [Hypoxylon trugodes]